MTGGTRHHPGGRPRPLVGLGYRPGLFRRFFPYLGLVEVWEHTVDHYIHGGDGALGAMEAFAGGPPLALHSLDLSVGSPEAKVDPDRLERLRKVIAAAGVSEISDHLGFSRIGPHAMDHFAPLWLVPETLDLVAENVEFLQDRLGVRLALENITLSFDPGGDMTTAEFLAALTARTGCGVHLDITNLTINAANGYCDAADELAALDLDSVVSVHLAGGIEAGGKMRDAHSFPVPEDDLVWLERLLPDMPNCRTIVIERDGRHQAVGEVAEDLRRIRAIVSSTRTGDPTHVPA